MTIGIVAASIVLLVSHLFAYFLGMGADDAPAAQRPIFFSIWYALTLASIAVIVAIIWAVAK